MKNSYVFADQLTDQNFNMMCRINLRRDQSLQLRNKFLTTNVTVFAPLWVRQGLIVLGNHLSGVQFGVFENFHRPVSIHRNPPKEFVTISEDFNGQSLTTLQRIARNESSNVSGIIEETLYPGIDQKVLLSIRDLVRQTVIVGTDYSSMCGGYMKPSESHERQKVYICDLAALQFQQKYNSGRLVLVEEEDQYKGILDDFIFENVVGEKRKTYQEVSRLMMNPKEEMKDRFLRMENRGEPNPFYFDTYAYSSFVKMDVVLSGTAISLMVSKHDPGEKIHFKFLKYGTGFFAGRFTSILEKLILPAVLSGLEVMLENSVVKKVVKSIELPFFQCNEALAKDVTEFESKHDIKVFFTKDDALKPYLDGTMIATTNCGDPHAPLGNEMGFSSVDAAIAENLESKGNAFCPNINVAMTEEYVDLGVRANDAMANPPSLNSVTKQIEKASLPADNKPLAMDPSIKQTDEAGNPTIVISKEAESENKANL